MPGSNVKAVDVRVETEKLTSPKEAATLSKLRKLRAEAVERQNRELARQALQDQAAKEVQAEAAPTRVVSSLCDDLENIAMGIDPTATARSVAERIEALEAEVADLHERLDDKALEGEL